MSSLSIVEDLHVSKQADFGLLTGCVSVSVNQFLLQSGEEAFDRCVVPTVAATTHAAHDAMLLEPSLVIVSRILTAPVAVEEQLPVGIFESPTL